MKRVFIRLPSKDDRLGKVGVGLNERTQNNFRIVQLGPPVWKN